MSEEVEVEALPKCDICWHNFSKESVAHYDGKTILGGVWGNMCEKCFQTYGSGLGTGKGQRLIVRNPNA